MSADVLDVLGRLPAIGILRGCPPQHVEAVAGAAAGAGFVLLEVTLDSPEPFRSIERVPGAVADVLVGAGTVRTAAEAHTAIDSGAAFLLSPLVDSAVIAAAVERGVPIIPGAATPTEVWQALEAGAGAVKIFPASHLGGPGFIASILAPLGHPRLVATGGVTAANAKAFLDAGAFAVGVGGSVFSREALEAGDGARIGSAASLLIEAIS